MQLTDFENAAFTTFITLLNRVILAFDLNLYIPLSRVDANMQRAHGRDAAKRGKFFFRRHMAPLEKGDEGYEEQYVSMFSVANGKQADSSHSLASMDVEVKAGVSEKRRVAPNASGGAEENSYEEMTMAEIMTGKGGMSRLMGNDYLSFFRSTYHASFLMKYADYFPGLIPLVYAYLDHIQCDTVTMERMAKYLDFIEKRATGELLTPATWMRNFVRSHEDYKFDSVITDSIA